MKQPAPAFLSRKTTALVIIYCSLTSCRSSLDHTGVPQVVITQQESLEPAPPPSDAIILFDGTDLSQWQRKNGKPAKWKIEDEYVEVKFLSGSIWTKESFGDVQLHVEWSIPASIKGSGQHRGNSGIKFMGLYEVQILDSYENSTYPTGMAGAVYGQHAPLVNASRPTGKWQSYDIVFRRPRFDETGSLIKPAEITAFFNGILVQDHSEVAGPTKQRNPSYEAHPDRLPIMLQNHRSRVRFRNIWVRKLE